MEAKVLLVTGATGKQGKALISAIQADEARSSPFHILALTRNAKSPAAKQLSLRENVQVVEGNLDDADSIRKIFEDTKKKSGIWGVFCVLAFPGLGANADGEEKQGKTLADLALEYGVSCFIYSSVERGGEGYDDNLTLDRLAKVRIERHIREPGDKGLNWTILRPGFFMENFEGTIGSVTVGVLKAGLKPDTAIQLIAVDDIGFVAAAVFKTPERYTSEVLLVVGDICTTTQLQNAYKSAVGREIPSIPSFLARALIKMNGHTQGLIQDIERVHLTRIDPNNEENRIQMATVREAYPEMTSFATWAAQRHGAILKREKGWNQVTLGRLLTGVGTQTEAECARLKSAKPVITTMFARQTLARASQAAAPSGARNMATLREIELRLKSVRNIQKITQSMKVVASTKLAKAQRAMQAGKQYGIANAEVFAHSPSDAAATNRLFIVISSDKGLCGGIHSAVSKATRRALSNAEDSPLPGQQVDSESPVMIIGDKSKGQLLRPIGQNIRLTFNQIGRDIPTFADAAGVADLIVKSGVKYDSVVLIYNKFVSAISYEPAAMEIKGELALKDSNAFKAYENEDDATKDLAEFSLANAIFAALTESHACEQSSRRNAMDNASKNAGEMIGALTMQYNRGRQAAITNELVDIITGASAL